MIGRVKGVGARSPDRHPTFPAGQHPVLQADHRVL